MLIGADGRMASCARQYVQGSNAPTYQGVINWIGVFESERATFQNVAIPDYRGVGVRFNLVLITQHKAYWAGGVSVDARRPTELAKHFSDWPSPVELVVDQTPVAHINQIYGHDHDQIVFMPGRYRVMIGDAAHAALPTSGPGACQALEDAWHLANCLHDTSLDVQQAFTKFTAIRFKKTSGIISAARNFSAALFNDDEAFCQARNENSKNTDFDNIAAGMAQGWAQSLPLRA